MRLVDNTPNWIQVFEEDEIPPTNEWEFEDLKSVVGDDVLFQLHSCGKYTLIYRAEILLRRESKDGTKVQQNQLIVEVECPRDGENLRYAGRLQRLAHLPVQSFRVYMLQKVADRDV